jgi:hypothetical protein
MAKPIAPVAIATAPVAIATAPVAIATAPVVVTSPVEVSNIVRLRTAAVESESTVYGARRAYAVGINDMADVAWYADGQKLPAAIQTEKDAYYKALRAIKYSNPSNAWGKVKDYAKEDAIARGLFGEIAPEVSADGTVETVAETRDSKTLTLRYVEDLMVLHKASVKKAGLGDPEYTDKIRTAHAFLIQALKSMGVDIGI